jgi:hypothetical protein
VRRRDGETIGIEIAQDQAGIRHRRRLSTTAVTGRTWFGARALGTNPQPAGAVDPGDAATAGADRADIDHLRSQG